MVEGDTVFHDAARQLLKQNGSAEAALLAAKRLRVDGVTDHDRSFWRAVVGLLDSAKCAEEGE